MNFSCLYSPFPSLMPSCPPFLLEHPFSRNLPSSFTPSFFVCDPLSLLMFLEREWVGCYLLKQEWYTKAKATEENDSPLPETTDHQWPLRERYGLSGPLLTMLCAQSCAEKHSYRELMRTTAMPYSEDAFVLHILPTLALTFALLDHWCFLSLGRGRIDVPPRTKYFDIHYS